MFIDVAIQETLVPAATAPAITGLLCHELRDALRDQVSSSDLGVAETLGR